MVGRRCDVLDVREMLRRLRLGGSARAVAKGLGISRNTVREYVAWFEAEALLPGDAMGLPTSFDLLSGSPEPSRWLRSPGSCRTGTSWSEPGCRSRWPGSGSRERTRISRPATPRSGASCGGTWTSDRAGRCSGSRSGQARRRRSTRVVLASAYEFTILR